MSFARRLWKWSLISAAVLVLLLVLSVAGLRLWLESSPTVAADVVARVEAATGLRIRFDRLEAHLGWYGPELVFRNARILAKRSDATLVSARAGHVGFDVWRAIASGRLASARVLLDGAVVHVLLQPSGIALLGQEALNRGETESTPLKIADLPVGRVGLSEGVIVVEDERQISPGFTIEHVRLELDRRPSALKFSLVVKLPAALGRELDVRGTVDGTGEPDSTLRWKANADGRDLNFAGFSSLLNGVARLPDAGKGSLHVSVVGTNLFMTNADATFDLRDLSLPEPGAPRDSPGAVAGSIGIEHVPESRPGAGSEWRLRVRDLSVKGGKESLRGGRADADWTVRDGAVQRFRLKVPELPLGALAPFSALAGAETVREAGKALRPRGRLTDVDLTATRAPSGPGWAVDGAATFRGLGIDAWRAVPGFAGVDGEFAGHGSSGTVSVRAAPLTLDLAQYLRAPVTATRVAAKVDWTIEADGVHLASDDATVVTPDAHGAGLVRLWLPGHNEPPHLVLDLKLADAELKGSAKYLPLLRFPVDAVAWLDDAFLAGRITEARVQYVGPTEGFPFRDRQGLWLVHGLFSGARVHFANGWADVEDAAGDLEFRNQGFAAHLKSARIAGLNIGAGEATMTDFRDADLEVHGTSSGELHRALKLLQTSPLAKSLGSYFGQLEGRGLVHADVSLDLPLRHFGDRRIGLDARLEHASVRLPGLEDEVSDINGDFRLTNLDLTVRGLKATVLGGPVSVTAETVSPGRGGDGLHVTTVHVDGHASADRLMPQLGITEAGYLSGGTDWHADVRLPRLEWMKPLPPLPPTPDLGVLRARQAGLPVVVRPDERPPLPRREPEARWLPIDVRLDSTLGGLGLNFPAPVAKPAEETRRLKAAVSVDPGVREDDEVPPKSLADGGAVHPPRLAVQATLGADSFAGEWLAAPAAADGKADAPTGLKLTRGSVHFGTGSAKLRDAPGVWVDGHLARFDLSAWLRVHTSDKPGSPMSSWLKGGEVSVDSFGILGFTVRDLVGDFRAGDDAWTAHGSGPTVAGRVQVPYDLHGPEPVVLDMERLVLNEVDQTTGTDARRDPPADLPALRAKVGSFEFMKRKLGTVEASLSRIPGGLRLDRAEVHAPTFSAQATGRWTGQDDSEWVEVDGTAHSTDVRETLVALAFEPSMSGPSADVRGQLRWRDGLDATILERLNGHAHVQAKEGQILTVQPGAGRVLGLLSVANLPRRLALDFHDLTEKGFAFDSLQGDFDFRDGNAYTNNLVVKGPAADIGLIGRTGFKAQDYDQTAVVTGHFSDGLAAAGAIVGGPVIGGALFLFGKVFQGAVEGSARGYYRISGTWDKPKVDSIGSTAAREAEAGSGALTPAGSAPAAEPSPVQDPSAHAPDAVPSPVVPSP